MIDAHHHIWRQKDLPWLLGPEQPRIFGPYAPIKRDYLVDEFREDLSGTEIEKSVYVQANWAPNWFADEAAWVQSVADETGWPHAIVAFADFTIGNVRPQLERLKPFPLMRGLRQQFHWHENPFYRFAKRPDL
ncbi:MAG: amidohydrolase, partial [Pseudomonadota bacterium]